MMELDRRSPGRSWLRLKLPPTPRFVGVMLILLAAMALIAVACSGSQSLEGHSEDQMEDQPSADTSEAVSAGTVSSSATTTAEASSSGTSSSGTPTTAAPTIAAPTTTSADVATTAVATTVATTTVVVRDVNVAQIPGGPRESTVSALREGMTAPSLPEPLVAPSEVISGGPPPDGIPSIDAPKFERATDIDFVQPQEAVIALTLNGDSRAYPVQVLIWHEIVNDTVGGEPVTVTYCPLCNTAIGYYRQLGDRILDFGTSGRLYNSALVMYDRQTESLWSHYTGQAIAGALTGSQLELIPVATVAFETFLAEHPNGLVMTRPAGVRRDYGRNPYTNYDQPDGSPFLFNGIADPRLAPQTRVLVIRHGGQAVAVVHEVLETQGVMTAVIGDVEVVAFHLPGTATPIEDSQVALGRDVGATAVHNPTVDGRQLTFTRVADAVSSAATAAFIDNETGSSWSLLGRALAGPLAGTQLESIEHVDTFWFAAAAFNSDIQILGAD